MEVQAPAVLPDEKATGTNLMGRFRVPKNLSRGCAGKSVAARGHEGRRVKLPTYLHQVPRLSIRGACTSTRTYTFMTWCVIKHKDEFTVFHKLKKNFVALVRKRTIWTERPPIVGEVIANFLGRGCRVVSPTAVFSVF
jgi:hypothetical protein